MPIGESLRRARTERGLALEEVSDATKIRVRYLRALDADTGQVLWQTRLASQAAGGTVTYSVNGRQYIAIPAGGGGINAAAIRMTPDVDAVSGGNAVYVLALPQ